MARIRRIGVKQTAKFVALFYFFVSLVFTLPIFLITLFLGTGGGTQGSMPFGGAVFGGIFILLLPLFYAVMGGVMTLVGAFLYNLIAKWVGGIEVEIEPEGTQASTKQESAS